MIYKSNITKYKTIVETITKKYNQIGALRLILIVLGFIFIRKHIMAYNIVYLGIAVLAFVAFVMILKRHKKLRFEKKLNKTLLKINEKERDFMDNNVLSFDAGDEFITPGHEYSFDLDVFGKNSLYQFLNRTGTYLGRVKLSQLLKSLLPNKDIMDNQDAVDELASEIDFRQKVLATSIIHEDREDIYTYLMKWVSDPLLKINSFIKILSYLFPLVFIVCVAIVSLTGNVLFLYISELFFVFNLAILVTQLNRIKGVISKISNIDKIILQYSHILDAIENKEFKSKKINDLQDRLKVEGMSASQSLGQLSSIFQKVESIQNGMAAILLNGSVLYHLHAFDKLIRWKNENASGIKVWLDVIGEFEALNSLGNFKYNNPSFCFPALNNDLNLEFSEMGHPLIKQEERVNNDVAFKQHKFVILTGSNMSGKSTFLRSLGTNMVLAGIGAPICAKSASIHPLNIVVSMRLSDSLAENESYFYTEVKRLKYIMEYMDKHRSLVLLDEILRGTNSDDKRNGTINVIKKLIDKKAIGVIATHDLEVCKTTDAYPNYLMNKCFEVEIVNNDLHFDYKMRDGICQNQSASFLMKKMEII